MKLGALRRILRGPVIQAPLINWKPDTLIVGEHTYSLSDVVIGIDPGAGSETATVVFRPSEGSVTFLAKGDKLAEHFFPKKPARRRR